MVSRAGLWFRGRNCGCEGGTVVVRAGLWL